MALQALLPIRWGIATETQTSGPVNLKVLVSNLHPFQFIFTVNNISILSRCPDLDRLS